MNLNKVFVAGNLVRDPELKKTPKDKSWCRVPMALNDRGKDGKERVSFIDVLLFGKTADAVCGHLRKGSGLFVEGAIQQDRWEDKQTGKPRSAICIRARYVQFVGRGQEAARAEGTETTQHHEVTPSEEETDIDLW